MRAYVLVVARLLGVLLLGVLPCCGGGGGGGTTPASGSGLFAGTYAMSSLTGDNGGPAEVTGGWGVMDADGIDAAQLTLATNEAGTITPAGMPEDLRFSVGLDRTLGFRIDGFPFLDILAGGITSTGEVAAAALHLVGGAGMYLFTRHGGFPTVASLNGPYHVVGYSYNGTLAIQTGWVGVATFNGSGGGTLSVGLNNNGFIAPFGPASFSYAVAPSGQITLDLGNAIVVTGRLTTDGELLIASGSTTSGGPPACFAFLRAGTAVTDTVFDGIYHAVAFGRDLTTLDHFDGFGGLFAMGDGNVSWYLNFKDESTQTVVESDSGMYATVANGSVVITTATDALRGAISADGRYAILGRLAGPDPDPSFWLLLR